MMASRDVIGSLAPVDVTDIGTNTLFGELISSSSQPIPAASPPTFPLEGRVRQSAGA
jgi:hypothetical protein